MNTKRAALWALVLPNLMLSRQGRRNGWTLWHVVGAYVMIALGALVTWEAWADIFHIARVDEESSHIYLVPPIVAWLLYVRRERLRYCRPTGQWIGPVVIAAGWAMASYGYYNSCYPRYYSRSYSSCYYPRTRYYSYGGYYGRSCGRTVRFHRR